MVRIKEKSQDNRKLTAKRLQEYNEKEKGGDSRKRRG
jgi:hypothetical protein